MANLPKFLSRILNWFEEPLNWFEEPPPVAPVKPTFLEIAWNKRGGGEQRASMRTQVHIPAELIDSLEGLPFSVAVENLSKHGLYFISDCSFTIGSAVEATLDFPAEVDGEPRRVHLVVRILRVDRRDDGRFGVAAQIMRCRTLEHAASGENSEAQRPPRFRV